MQFGSFPRTSAVTQAYVAKLDGAGNFLWIRTVDGPAFSSGSGVAVDAAGHVTVVGHFYAATATFGPFQLANADPTLGTPDIYVAQLDAAGTWRWAARAGGPSFDAPTAVALDAQGAVYVTGGCVSASAVFGPFALPAIAGNGSIDLFVAKMTPQGSWLWARSGGGGGGGGGGAGRALAVTAGGTVYVAGVSANAAPVFGPFALPATAGTNNAMVVVQLDPNGAWQWAATGGGSLNDAHSTAVALDAAGNAYVAGRFTGPTATFGATTLANIAYAGGGAGDVFVARLDAAGRWQWVAQAGGAGDDGATGLAFDAAGRLVVAGTFGSTTAQFGATALANTAAGGGGNAFRPSSIFLAYLGPAGTWLGAVASQGGGDEQPVCVAADAYGNTSLGGAFQGASLTLGAATLAGAGASTSTTSVATLVPMVPVVDALAPGSGAPGQAVAVTGSGFAGVVAVLFNGVPAASFAVQSPNRLMVATVPPGATAGPVSVRTSVGAANSPQPFLPLALAAGAAAGPTGPLVWPNPTRAAEPWHLDPAGVTGWVEVRNLLGQLVFATPLRGGASRVPVAPLVPGIYQLTLRPDGQPARRQRVVVD